MVSEVTQLNELPCCRCQVDALDQKLHCALCQGTRGTDGGVGGAVDIECIATEPHTWRGVGKATKPARQQTSPSLENIYFFVVLH